jgi:hypothetical protein
MSIPKNNIVREVAPKSLFESAFPVLDNTVDYNQGDLIAFDTGNNILKPFSATGDAANILGVARQTLVNGVTKSPYQGTSVDASQAIEDVAGPVYGIVARMTLKDGDIFNPGDKVYGDPTDPQTVTSTDNASGANIGIYQGRTITAGSASTGDVLIGARYGLSGIQF